MMSNSGAQQDKSFELELNNNIHSQMIHGQNSERILWLGDFSVCIKGLKHYPAFIRDKTTVTVHSFALIKGEDENEHIGYVEDLYEDYSGHKMVKVRWFNCCEEPYEVMITPDVEVVSAECIPGLATVLTPKHYDQSLAVVSEDFSDGVYMCSRQIRNNRVTAFTLSKLRGYANQAIFSILNPPVIPQPSPPVIPQPSPPVIPAPALSDVGEEIEVLHDDSGLRGSWFRCRILKAKGKRLKVVYVDLEKAEGNGNTEEWIAGDRVAEPDKLGMRHLGRDSIRPWPRGSTSNACYSVGDAVDAWWCDAWWEGVVISSVPPANDTYRVYFPGEHRFVNCEKKNLRSSKDWVGNKWIQIRPKPDILNVLASSQKEKK